MPEKRENVIVGMPTKAGPPGVESIEKNCRECGQAVWLSVAGSGVLLHAGAGVMCLDCYNTAIADEDTIEVNVTPTVLRQMSEYAGRPFTREDAEALIRRHYNNPHIRVILMGDTDSN